MKSLFILPLMLCLLTIQTQASDYAFRTLGPKWEKLGSRTVNFGIDRDEILVTAAEGIFDALQIRVKRGGINMHNMVIHFGDGSTQDVELKHTIRQGKESRIIDLKGNNRIIRKVVFVYDTKNYRNKRAIVELWGRH